MKVGITGASGFIGSLLVKKHLELDDEVYVLSRNKSIKFKGAHLCFGNLLDINSLVDFVKDIDVLYHCAAEIRDESKMKDTNVLGTKNLIQVASKKIKHWVQLSSVGVYGPIYSGVITEEQKYNPFDEYEKTKLDSDLLVLEATKNKVFTSTIIRPSNVFSSEMRNQSLFDLIKSVDRGYYFFIGKKGASANYVAVENVIDALYLAGTNRNAVNEIFNISSNCTIEEFIGIIANELNKPIPRFRMSKNGMLFLANITYFIPKNPLKVSRVKALTNRSVYSILKIEMKLNYKPVNTIKNGIEGLVRSYKLQVN